MDLKNKLVRVVFNVLKIMVCMVADKLLLTTSLKHQIFTHQWLKPNNWLGRSCRLLFHLPTRLALVAVHNDQHSPVTIMTALYEQTVTSPYYIVIYVYTAYVYTCTHKHIYLLLALLGRNALPMEIVDPNIICTLGLCSVLRYSTWMMCIYQLL